MDKVNDGRIYLGFAIGMARDIGINVEESIEKLAGDENEAEDLRRIWWWLYHIDRNLAYTNQEFIKDSDLGLFPVELAKIGGKKAQLSISVMSSVHWYTPSISGVSFRGHRVLLNRMYGKTLHYNYLFRNNAKNLDLLLVSSTLEDSLAMWYANLPKDVIDAIQVIYNPALPIADHKYTCTALDAILQYQLTKIMVNMPVAYQSILNNTGSKCYVFGNTISSCKELSVIVSFYLSENPTFHYTLPLTFNFIFQSIIPLVVAIKLGLSKTDDQIQSAFDILAKAVAVLSQMQQRGSYVLNLLNHMLSLPTALNVMNCYYKNTEYSGNPLSLFIPSRLNSDESIALE
ncbi:hypothetical protein HDV01_004583 [Terramyces sp. JEL0728]|nr:hypothetical protein HDV01_004583 [Terramyces sp. JEL0728]